MTTTHRSTCRRREAGYSLVELLVAMGITTLVMGATLAGLSDAVRASDTLLQLTSMNSGLRAGMDLIVRDLLQTGSGLPKGHVILVPSGGELLRRPGPPTTTYTLPASTLSMPAVVPGAGLGPVVNGVATDMISILTADNNFTDVAVTAVANDWIEVPSTLNITTGMDRVIEGQLMMVYKGTASTLVQVTAVNGPISRIYFASGDSLKLNQTATGIAGNLRSLNAQAPTGAAAPAATRLTRVRMISFYLDNTTTPGRPRLVRRINNGHPTSFSNTLGTAVALDIENLQFSYDINDGAANPSNVRFTAADLNGTGVCAPDACSPTQIRKVNIVLTARSATGAQQLRAYRNTLQSQVALRGMALVNEYQN